MHRRAISCGICGKKYFPASLPFHLKACQIRHAALLDSLAESMPKPRMNRSKRRVALKTQIRKRQPLPTLQPSDEPLMLRKCSHCGRNFSMIRIQAHEEICRKVKKRRTQFKSSMQRTVEGSSGMLTRPVSRASRVSKSADHARTRGFRGSWRSNGGSRLTVSYSTEKPRAKTSYPSYTVSHSDRKGHTVRSRVNLRSRPFTMGAHMSKRMGGSPSRNGSRLGIQGKEKSASRSVRLSRTTPKTYSKGWSGRGATGFAEGKGGFDPSNRTSRENPLLTCAWQAAPH
uniref:C2HC/C3H-type domain-containing protein n=1 Tax=Lotharella globosa TaxID=91324 RepID=A0A7S4DEQ7_9EUKA|mmetsp:Transcript_4318/g.8546  ORF Transcript_4318/g.8546 Transcript_4318/m.8546 type:complete len:286 (-) Transcript_4318:202-1059(-)